RRRPYAAAEDERKATPEHVRDRSGRHLEEHDGDAVGREHRVRLEQVEAAAQQEERVDRPDEELREVVGPGQQVVRADDPLHGEPTYIDAARAASQRQRLHARRADQNPTRSPVRMPLSWSWGMSGA